jgi:hypothetical protein
MIPFSHSISSIHSEGKTWLDAKKLGYAPWSYDNFEWILLSTGEDASLQQDDSEKQIPPLGQTGLKSVFFLCRRARLKPVYYWTAMKVKNCLNHRQTVKPQSFFWARQVFAGMRCA